jgi:DNA repair exonuclease SbcCD nuclease subunit
MKILHTADLHLREYNDSRWLALQEIIGLGKAERIDVLAISGDLFENHGDAQQLRPKIRELFADADCPVLIIPGNHDAKAYPDGVFLGETVTVLRDLLSPLEINGFYFWGFPYEDLPEEEILKYLNLAAGMARPGAVHLLLFHGELLDITGNRALYGEEGRQRYLPVKLSYFARLPWQYVLAGHFHSNFDVHEFAEDRYFVYPGSPVSITRREIGRRKVNLFETGKPPSARALETFYYDKLEIRLNPLEQEDPLPMISAKLKNLPENVKLLLEISGYFNGKKLNKNERELHETLKKLAGAQCEIAVMEFQDIREILEDDIFKLFMERLKARPGGPEEKKQILEVALKGMMEVNT